MNEHKNFWQWLLKPESIKNARTVIVIVLVVAVPLLYFGYADSLTLTNLLSFQFGGISVVVALTAFLANKEARLRAFDNAYEMDKEKGKDKGELEEKEDTYQEHARTIQNKDPRMKRSVEFINEYNKEQQDMYNRIKTDDEIAKLERRAVKLRLDDKDKKANKVDKQIERLKQEPLFDNKFDPYDIKEIVNANRDGRKRRKRKGNAEIKVNPTKVNPFSQGFSTFIRGLTGGVAGTAAFTLSESPSTIFWFYITYTGILAFTVITAYSITVWRTLGSYKNSLERKINIQELLIEKLNTKEAQHERTEIQHEESSERANEDDSRQDSETPSNGGEIREEDRGGKE